MNEYEGHWITTYSGKRFHYLNPSENEIDIRDIAHALALTCRFGGQIKTFYSVAEHSIRVAEEVPFKLRLSALLHDAHEAYLHDIPRPIKQDILGYKEVADRIQRKIEEKYCLVSSPLIKTVDNKLLITEARDLGMNTTDWAALGQPLDKIIYPWSWQDAEASFLTYFVVYGGKDKDTPS